MFKLKNKQIRKWKIYNCTKVLFYHFLLLLLLLITEFTFLVRISEIKYLAWTTVLVTLTWNKFCYRVRLILKLLCLSSGMQLLTLLTLLFTITLFKLKKKKVSIMNKTNRNIFNTKVLSFLVRWGAGGMLLLMKLKHTHC